MKIKKFNVKQFFMKYIMYFVLVIMCVILSLANDSFLTANNLMTIVKQISIQSIVAIGMTMIIITGNIDLSVGSIVAFASVIGAMMMKSGLPIPAAILLTLACSGMLGFVSGGVTAKLKLHSFLVTLALMQAFRGLAQTLTGGYPVAGLPDSFGKIASGSIGPVPYLVIYMVIFYAIFIYIMKYTAFGRSIYAVGGNQESARLSGINTKKVFFLAYTNMAFLAAVAGLVFAARLQSSAPTAGQGFELDAIGACFIGGASAYGGIGTVGGVLIGAIFMGVLNNGMSIVGIGSDWQQIVKGLVLLFAVAFDVVSKSKTK